MSVFKPLVKYRFRCRFIDAWIMSQLRVYWSTCKINNSYEGKVLNPILDRSTKVDLKFEAHLCSVWSKMDHNFLFYPLEKLLGVAYVRFISYSKCYDLCRISKLSSNFGCLFTFWYLDGENLTKTNLHICNLWTVSL